MTGAVWLKYSIGLKCLEREAFCLSPSPWLSIKLMGWREEGRRRPPHSHCDGGRPWGHGIWLGVSKGGAPVKAPVQAFLLANLFSKQNKRP